MNEPLSSLDPLDWFVYSDWLYNQGRDEESERSKRIGRGLERTKGLLYLYYQYEGEDTKIISHVHVGLNVPISLDLNYRWTDDEHRDHWIGHDKVSPLQSPQLFKDRPDVVTLYWDKLADVGGEGKMLREDPRR